MQLNCPLAGSSKSLGIISVIAILGLVAANPLLAEEAPFSPYESSSYYTHFLFIEIDLSSRQLTLNNGETQLKSYPIAVGREGWQTPTGSFQVMEMFEEPIWQNPFTGEIIQGGDPRNPLGDYWIGFWTDGTNWVGMHGTPHPETVGTAASHGCIRLYNSDIEELFTLIQLGTPVTVVP